MKTAAIIAEGNPLHNGHAFLFAKAKETLGADFLIALMSGDFVQRGEPAIIDKHRRARTALAAGADLVLMLPTVYSVAPAEIFARGAVATLDATGIVDTLFFGSEAGTLLPLQELAALLPAGTGGRFIPDSGSLEDDARAAGVSSTAGDPDTAFHKALLTALRGGASYPRAMEQAITGTASDRAALAALLHDAPNNILGVEYLRSLAATKSRMTPATIARTPASDTVTSAAMLRSMMQDALAEQGDPGAFHAPLSTKAHKTLTDRLAPYLPSASRAEFEAVFAADDERPVFADDLTPALQYRLALCEDSAALANIGDVGADLAHRIYNMRLACDGFERFAVRIKVRTFTLARIRRALLQLLLDIRRNERDAMLAADCTALRVLGFRKSARPLLQAIGERKSSAVPLIVRGADFSAPSDDLTKRLIAIDLAAGALYGQLALSASARRHEAKKPPVIL